MSIQNDLLELFQTPRFRYKGMSVNIFGLPIFKDYKRNSINTALSRLRKKQYVTFEGSSLKLTENGKRFMKGTSGHMRLREDYLRDLDIAIPDLKIQKQIVQQIESRFSVIDKLEETVDNALNKAELLRKSILKSAFEGRLVKNG